MRNTAYDVPVFVAKGVKTSGHVSELQPLEIGIFDTKTSSIATASGNGKEFYLAGGKPHTRDSLAKFYSGMLDPKKSSPFKGKELISFEKAYPSRPSNEEWVIGYDGTAGSVGLTFEKNKQYKLKVRLFGEAALKKYNREVERVIHLSTFVCDDGTYCDGDCVDKTIDYKKTTIEYVKKINEDVELQEFKIKAYPVFDDYNATATTAAFTGGTLTSGTPVLTVTTVQGVITAVTVTGTYSYSANPTGVIITNATGGSGATFTISGSGSAVTVTVTNGGSGYTYASKNAYKYQIIVNDNGDADALFALERAYPTLKIKRVGYLSGKSVYEVVNLTAAPADFTPTSDVLLAACGTCPIGYTLVTGYDVWIVSRQLNTTTDLEDTASQNAFAAAVTTAYVSSTDGAISGTGVYLGVVDGSAKVKMNVYSGKVLVPASSTADQVEKIASTPSTCIASAPSAVSWVLSESGYSITRSLKVTLLDADCSGTVVATTADVVASLADVTSYVSGSVVDATGSDVCSKSFTITQRSQYMTDLCESPDVAKYDTLPTFRGVRWVEVVPTTAVNTTVKAGIRFTAPYFSVKYNDASFAPDEFSDSEPMQMQVSIYDQSGNPCLFAKNGLGKRTKQGKYRRLSGEFVARQVIRGGAYFTYEQWQNEPRIREVMDNNILSTTDRTKYYVAYYLRFKDSRGDNNFNQASEIFEPIVFIEENLTSVQTAFENSLLAVTSKFNVELETRG